MIHIKFCKHGHVPVLDTEIIQVLPMMSCSKTPIFFGANLFRSFLIDPEWEKWHDAELPGFRTTAEGGQHFLRG